MLRCVGAKQYHLHYAIHLHCTGGNYTKATFSQQLYADISRQIENCGSETRNVKFACKQLCNGVELAA